MAIVEMKRVSLLALRADRDRLLRAMQRMGCVEITEIQDEQLKAYLGRERGQAENAEEKLSRIKWAISLLSRYEVKKKSLLNMFSSIPDATEEEAQAVADDAQSVMAAVEACEACERREGDLRGREARANAQIAQLRPWQEFDIPVEKLAPTRETVQFAGTIAASKIEALEGAFAPLTAARRLVFSLRRGEKRRFVRESRSNVCVKSHRTTDKPIFFPQNHTFFEKSPIFFSKPLTFAGSDGIIHMNSNKIRRGKYHVEAYRFYESDGDERVHRYHLLLHLERQCHWCCECAPWRQTGREAFLLLCLSRH